MATASVTAEELASLVDAVADARDTAELAMGLASCLLDLVPGVSASYNEVDVRSGRAFARIVPEPRDDWWDRYQPVFEAHVHENPLFAAVARLGALEASTWDDVDPAGQFRSTTLFREFYQPLGIESQLVAAFTDRDGTVVGVAMNRDGGEFGQRERSILDAARSVAAIARRSVARLAERDALVHVLEREGWQLAHLDAQGAVLDTTDSDLAVGTSLRVAAAALADTVPPTANDAGHPVVSIAADREHGREVVVATGTLPPHLALIRQRTKVDPRALEALGLTPRQADIARHLATGASNGEIAAELSIAASTVKKHLEGVYAALGVTTRAAAVATLAAAGTVAPLGSLDRRPPLAAPPGATSPPGAPGPSPRAPT